tara:strand:- start:1337 stop:1549 length:213 start_codon:yes stop_codon:yes gene_type:complete
MHIHIKNSVADNMSVYESDSDDSIVIAVLDDSIVTAIVLDIAAESALKLYNELGSKLNVTQAEVIEMPKS